MSTPDQYELSLAPERVQMEVVHGFLRTCYWSPGVRREIVEKALANSIVVGAYIAGSGEQVGYARVVTDRATFAWLCDVFVLEPHRGRGLSRRMVQTLLAHPELQTLRRWALGTRDAHEVYRPLGFQPVIAERWMEKVLPVEGWKEPGQEHPD
jgi:GNAT superfamily N-acetyltransferase